MPPSVPVDVRHDPAKAGEEENRGVVFLDRERRLVNPSDVQLPVLDREQWLGGEGGKQVEKMAPTKGLFTLPAD